MADILRIKRRTSGAPGAPASLANAEIAFNEVDNTLYYGKGTGGAGGSATTVIPIGGAGLGSSANPLMDGVASAGIGALLSKEDHRHPTDTSRAPLDSPPFTGTPTAPTAAGGTNTTQIATTAFVTAAVQAQAQGLDPKESVRAASAAGVGHTLNGLITIDGYTTVAGDRILIKSQAAPADNGIYIASAGAWTRAPDTDTWNELISAFVFVEQGATNADSGWVCTVDQGGTLGTTPVTWSQFSGAGQLTAGAGLVKTGNTVDVVGTANRIVANADSIDIASNYVGQASITTLGTIVTGTWNGTTIVVSNGGTGATSLTGYVRGNGAAAMTAVAQIPNTDITGLGTMAVQNANAVAITGGTIDGITFDMGTF
jgi:hypothetical protein